MANPEISISDLIQLLDRPTLDALSSRLHRVAEAHETPVNPGQLLFGFIDECLKAYEEELDGPADESELAQKILAEIEGSPEPVS